MDLSTRLITANICGAMIFAVYFYMQTCGELLQVVSFFVAVPMIKVIIDRMIIPVRISYGSCYPLKELSMNFMKFNYGVWSVLLTEAIRRTFCGNLFDGVMSIMLMSAPLLVYVFSEATGMCYTNVKNYKKGTVGFCIVQWVLISISFLLGSSWSLQAAH